MDPRRRYSPGVDSEYMPVDGETAGWSRGRRFGVGLALVFAISLVALLVVGLVKGDPAQLVDERFAAGTGPLAPDFTLPVLVAGGPIGPEGAMVSLSSLRGKQVIVNEWASWCPPCRDEAPILQRLWERYRDKGVVVLGIDTQDGATEARAFIKELGLTFPSLRDGTDETKKKFRTGQLPETFVVDADGRLRQTIRGPLTSGWEREITKYLDGVVGT